MDEKRLSIETAMLLRAVNENPARHQYVPLKPIMDTPEITTWDLIQRVVDLERERDTQAERIQALEAESVSTLMTIAEGAIALAEVFCKQSVLDV